MKKRLSIGICLLRGCKNPYRFFLSDKQQRMQTIESFQESRSFNFWEMLNATHAANYINKTQSCFISSL